MGGFIEVMIGGGIIPPSPPAGSKTCGVFKYNQALILGNNDFAHIACDVVFVYIWDKGTEMGSTVDPVRLLTTSTRIIMPAPIANADIYIFAITL